MRTRTRRQRSRCETSQQSTPPINPTFVGKTEVFLTLLSEGGDFVADFWLLAQDKPIVWGRVDDYGGWGGSVYIPDYLTKEQEYHERQEQDHGEAW
jgi:hypothetical protein